MAIINFLILSEGERDTAQAFNNANVAIQPRAIDNASPGVGLNLNDQAVNYGPGDPVTLTGAFVAPKRIVDDPDYLTYAPGMVTYLLTLPFATLETETIFAPPPPEE